MDCNWAGNVAFGSSNFYSPQNLPKLQKIVSEATKIRVVGSAHSFNSIVATDDTLVSLKNLESVVEIDSLRSTVTFGASINLNELSIFLYKNGYALRMLPSTTVFNAVGACSTGTHGSGDTNKFLAAYICSMTLVTAEGDLVEISSEDLLATAIGLGAFGVVVSMTMEIEKVYSVAQEVHLGLPWKNAFEYLDEIMASAYCVSLFTTWSGEKLEQIWRKFRINSDTKQLPETPDEFYGASKSHVNVGPVGGAKHGAFFTTQCLKPGSPHERLPHMYKKTIPKQLQSEYYVDRKYGAEAVQAVQEIGPAILKTGGFLISEIRTIASDSLWLSPDCPSLAIHFTWDNNFTAVKKLLPLVEKALLPFKPKPHWGKLFNLPTSIVRGSYPQFSAFVNKASDYDPKNKFRNDFLADLIG